MGAPVPEQVVEFGLMEAGISEPKLFDPAQPQSLQNLTVAAGVAIDSALCFEPRLRTRLLTGERVQSLLPQLVRQRNAENVASGHAAAKFALQRLALGKRGKLDVFPLLPHGGKMLANPFEPGPLLPLDTTAEPEKLREAEPKRH